jgi:predicted metal-dependent HD superfamily phosphohydrolase
MLGAALQYDLLAFEDSMNITDAPDWLLTEWIQSCQAAGATASVDEIEQAGVRLLERWSHVKRHFHNLRHLADVLTRVDELASEAPHAELVRLAAYYHGAAFGPLELLGVASHSTDERSSAELAESELIGLGVPDAHAQRVASLISSLASPPKKLDGDAVALCDAELATLAVEPQKYKQYLVELREEYHQVSDYEFLQGRRRVLLQLLERAHLFNGAQGRQWESAARENMGAELHRIERSLMELQLNADDE